MAFSSSDAVADALVFHPRRLFGIGSLFLSLPNAISLLRPNRRRKSKLNAQQCQSPELGSAAAVFQLNFPAEVRAGGCTLPESLGISLSFPHSNQICPLVNQLRIRRWQAAASVSATLFFSATDCNCNCDLSVLSCFVAESVAQPQPKPTFTEFWIVSVSQPHFLACIQ